MIFKLLNTILREEILTRALTWGVEKGAAAFRLDRDVFPRIVIFCIKYLSILIGLPFFAIPGEITAYVALDIAIASFAVRGVPVTKARGATKIVLAVNVKVSDFASIALFAFDILLH